MKNAIKKIIAVGSVGMTCAGAGVAFADSSYAYQRGYSDWEPQRAGRWEATIGGRYSSYDVIDFRSDLALEPQDSFGVAFSLGYNFDPHLNLSFELFSDQADYSSTVDNGDGSFGIIDGELESSSGQFNLTYHLFDSAVTPFVSAGVGWSYIDSNIIQNYAGVECWYHPWYGYVCDDVYDTYDDTALSYNAAIGLRFDLGSNFFLRASVGRQWIYLDQTASNPSADFGRMELGLMF